MVMVSGIQVFVIMQITELADNCNHHNNCCLNIYHKIHIYISASHDCGSPAASDGLVRFLRTPFIAYVPFSCLPGAHESSRETVCMPL